MANLKSAQKRMRQNAKRRINNASQRSSMRTAIKSVRNALASGDVEAARTKLPEALQQIGKAASKGLIHNNTASRYSSRLSRQVAGFKAADASAS